MPYTCIQRVLSVFSPLECQSAYNSARDAVNQRILKSDWLRIIQKWRELSEQKHNSFISWMSTAGHIWKIRILRDIGFAKETTLRRLIFEEINFREIYFRVDSFSRISHFFNKSAKINPREIFVKIAI